DLVVVGGGISGLAAAWFYRRAAPDARILILDNHDDFGGHAKRNEFMLDGKLLIGYGGSQSIDSPATQWSTTAKGLLRDLGVNVARFETAFERTLYSSLGLSTGLFLPRESYGRDVLVAGDPLAGKTAAQKRDILKTTSYRAYLMRICGCSAEAADCFQGRTLDYFGLGCDSVPAEDAREAGYPGFRGLKLPADGGGRSEPYIYHFPDGNASLARLLVRALIPGVAPGGTMDDVVLAPFDYGKLDERASKIRIRLDASCIDVRNADGRVVVGYVRGGTMHRLEAKHTVLACFHMMIPHLMPELPAAQRAALAQNVKTPIVYTNVLVRNWRAFAELKVHAINAPVSFHNQVPLDFPVSLGGYRHPRHPSEPVCLHLAHVAGEPNRGLTAREQFRIGQGKLLQMTFADFEARITDELDRMLGPGGFSSAHDIAAITVNRWPHGYGYAENSLFDGDDYDETLALARRQAGRVAIANSDAGGDAYAHLAIDEAARAVRELLG
ncbi:MAG: spermidine dehydrogenase, partial [Alphaproteobacteria bacterium]|nr:spermidine dehydrogenase [Alphaproteobacteria bacterium]